MRPIFQENMEHPLPPGIFVEMKPSPNEFDDWTEEDFDNEIRRLRERIKELESQKVAREEHDDDDDEEEETMIEHVDKLRAHFC